MTVSNTNDSFAHAKASPVDGANALQPIVFVRDGEIFASSKDVAAYFGKRHDHVIRDVRQLHCSNDFKLRNFGEFKINDLTGETTSHFEMTKDGFTFLAMGFTGETAGRFKEAFIARFNAMEAGLRSMVDPMKVLSDPAQMRTLLLGYAEKQIALEGQIEEMRPQVQALDRIANSDGSLCVTDAAKTLQVQPKALFMFLRSHHWIYSRAGSSQEVAYQDKLASGLLEHKTTTVTRSDGSEKTVTQVRVTSKGLTRLAKEFPSTVSQVA